MQCGITLKCLVEPMNRIALRKCRGRVSVLLEVIPAFTIFYIPPIGPGEVVRLAGLEAVPNFGF